MATTTILQPQDCLHRSNPNSPAFTPSRNPNRDRNTSLRLRRRKQTSVDNANKKHVEGRRLVLPRIPSNNLVMGQVRILKRGEELSKPIIIPGAAVDRRFVTDDDFVLSSTDRLGPDPEMVQKHVRVSDGLYAGPALLLASPPPSSLPFPAFFAKERKHDAATSDLRRLLRLDLA